MTRHTDVLGAQVSEERPPAPGGSFAEQTKALARSNAELERFAYVASHELQEPLRVITNYTRLLRRRYQGKLDADADEFMDYTVDAAVRMRQLIEDLLTYSRVTTRRNVPEPIDAGEVLDRVLRELRPAIEESDAEVRCDALPVVLVDGGQLASVFHNLVANAIKFRTAQRPSVRVSAEEQDGTCRFAVRDNGIGLDAKDAERVFTIFQRLHGRDDYPGTGIGLALCKTIVELHGGRIWFESEPGCGATFYFTLPSADDDGTSPATVEKGGHGAARS